MATIQQLATYSQTAQMAYADNLVSNGNNTAAYDAIQDVATSQAAQFNATWKVLQQSAPSEDGFSAVLLQKINTDGSFGEKVLAIRGTDASSPSDWFTDIVNIAFVGSIDEMDQYSSLEGFYQQLVSSGKLGATEQITVTGHSLGGFLAQAFTVEHYDVVSAAYTYNAPGFGGGGAELNEFLGVTDSSIAFDKITNVFAIDGFSATAGLGFMLGSAEGVNIESGILTQNHSIGRLADSLAVQSLLSRLDASFSQSTANLLTQAASNESDSTLELLLDAVRRMLIGPSVGGTGVDDRQALYVNLEALNDSLDPTGALLALVGKLNISSAGLSVASYAKAEFSALVSLQVLSPVVMLGTDPTNQTLLNTTLGSIHSDLYTQWQADQALSAAERAAGKANFSDAWLEDRATMLSLMVQGNLTDEDDPLGIFFSDGVARNYIDVATGTQIETGDSEDPKSQIVFGRSIDDTINGGALGDRLYGGGGADGLYGGAGDDYLEGGTGNDVLNSGTGRDTLEGGGGFDSYWVAKDAQSVTIRDTDGDGAIVIERPDFSFYTLGSGLEVTPGSTGMATDDEGNRYVLSGTDLNVTFKDGRSIVVRNFSDDTLGINLPDPEPAVPEDPPPSTGTYVIDPNDPDGGTYTGSFGSGGVRNGQAGASELYSWAAVLAPSIPGIYEDETIDMSDGVPIPNSTMVAVYGGLGDSHITGSQHRNVLVDGVDFSSGSGVVLWEADASGNDTLIGGALGDVLQTHGGDDQSFGGAGNDVLIDTPVPNGSTDFGDTSWVDDQNHSNKDVLYGEAGNDIIIAGPGDGYLDGGIGNDELYGGANDDILIGGDGNDVLSGDTRQTGDLWMYAIPQGIDLTVSFDNSLGLGYLIEDQVAPGKDLLDGGEGNDTLLGGGDDDTLIGGAGADILQGDTVYVPGGTQGLYSTHGTTPLALQGSDLLYGDAGDDTIYGGGGDDFIYGGADNDTVYGGAGDDNIEGGTGTDTLIGDDLTGAQGVDKIYGNENNDTLYGMGGGDYLYGGDGDDVLIGGAGGTATGSGNDVLQGGNGSDQLFGQDGDDVLIGGVGQDLLQGDAGNDRLETDGGNDSLLGGANDDTFVLSKGSGYVQITDTEGVNTLIFGPEINSSDVRVSRENGIVYLDFSSSDYAYMSLATFNALQTIQFADGLTWTSSDLQQEFEPGVLAADRNVWLGAGVSVGEIGLRRWNNDLLLTYDGSVSDWVDTSHFDTNDVVYRLADGSDYGFAPGTDVLVLTNWYLGPAGFYLESFRDASAISTSFLASALSAPATFSGGNGGAFVQATTASDVLQGGAGSDILTGGEGNDDISGAAGEDLLSGGAGNDIYRFNIGDGKDIIVDDAGNDDVVRFGPGIASADLTVTETAAGLNVQVGPSANGDQVLIANWAQGGGQSIDRFVFDNGASLDRAAVDALNTGNHSPRTTQSLEDQRTRPGDLLTLTLPTNLFIDADAGDSLTTVASQGGGLALPAWLTYDAQTRTFSGTPQQADIGAYNISITAIDQSGLRTTVVFKLVVPNAQMGTAGNDSLVAGDTGEDLLGLQGDDSLWGGSGSDVLDGDEGSDYIIGNGGGDVLIGGEGDDILDGGTGDDSLIGGHGADYLVGGGGENLIKIDLGDGSDEFSFGAAGQNTVLFGAGIQSSYVTASASVQAVQTAPSTSHYVLRLPYNPADPNDYLDIQLTTDTTGLTPGVYDALASMTLEFSADQPVNAAQLFDETNVQTSSNDLLFATPNQTTVHGGEGDDRLYGIFGSLVTLNGDDGNDILSGDGTLNGGAGNDALTAGGGNDGLDGGDGDDVLYASAGNDTLIGGAQNDTLTGGAGSDQLMGGQGNDVYVFDSYSGGLFQGGTDTIVDVGGVDRAEFEVNLLNQPPLHFLQDGDDLVLEWSGSGYITTSYRFSDWFSSSDSKIEQFKFSDGTFNAQQIEGLVSGVNTAPNVSVPIADKTQFYEGAFSFSIPGNTFVDTQPGTGLTYSASLAGGGALPSWLTFNPSTLQFSGTAPATAQGTLNIEVTATDPGSLSTSDTFAFNIVDPTLPYYGSPNSDIIYGTTHNNTFYGLDGNDFIFGLDGADTIDGGLGDDQIDGGNGVDILTGGIGDDYLIGGSGADVLDGGTGADAMGGGTDDDDYIVDDESDLIVEGVNQGIDEVFSSVDYTLSDNVEKLTLAGSDPLSGFGNGLANTIIGNSAANNIDGSSGTDQMIGGAGDDVYTVDDAGDAIVEQAGEGIDQVLTYVSYTLPSNVENLTIDTTTGLFNATGNTLDNVLIGNWSANTLDGGVGADLLVGDRGNDTYLVDNLGDVVIEDVNEGTDSVQSSVNFTLAANVENLTLIGTANTNGTGNSAANSITGNSGNNVLDGAGGADALNGGAGNDTYIVDVAGDSITDSSGTDTVVSAINYTLGSTLENLTLAGSALTGTGNTLDNIITGNASNNTLTGNSGNDTLDGGAGNDSMSGGQGNDTFVVDSTLDSVSESSGQGTDIVQSSVNWTLGSNVENLTLLGSGNITGTGNTLNNTITGNSGNNTLDPGSSGTDALFGGQGNDIYVVTRTTGITITENVSEGTDLVNASVAYTLGNNLENLTLTGTSAINGTGNTLDNVITGNSGNNTLTGSGGNDTLDPGSAGTDSLVGGTGDDIYVVNRSTGITITESASAGTDQVQSSVTHTLGSNIELLFLTGSSNINGTGNTLNNLLRGNTGNNILAGSTGVDILEGGGGTDTLSDSGGNTLLSGGAGTDTLTSGSTNDILIGGVGNDALTTGSGADIIVFNKGDGQDTVAASTTKDNTLAVGGGAVYADLLFQKSGNDLILKVGASDQITFTGYYTGSNRSVDKLQIVIEGTADYDAGSGSAMNNKKIETFNFDGLVTAFDNARAADPNLTSWSLTNALLTQHLSGSDTAAIGGDLAYRYGRFGNLSDISFTPAAAILAAAGFGSSTQTLQSLGGLQDTSPRLS